MLACSRGIHTHLEFEERRARGKKKGGDFTYLALPLFQAEAGRNRRRPKLLSIRIPNLRPHFVFELGP